MRVQWAHIGRSLPATDVFMLGVIFIVGSIYATYIRGDYVWYHDGGAYLSFARNIARDIPYDYGVDFQRLPPGYPLILAGWGTVFSWTISSFQVINLIFICLFSYGSFLLAKRFCPPLTALAIGIAVLLSPTLVSWRHAVATEFVFSGFMVWATLSWESAFKHQDRFWLWMRYFVIGVLLTAGAITIRSIGITIALASICVMITHAVFMSKYRWRHFVSAIPAGLTYYAAYNILPVVNGTFFNLVTASYIQLWTQGGIAAIGAHVWERLVTESLNIRDALLFWPGSNSAVIQGIINFLYSGTALSIGMLVLLVIGWVCHVVRFGIRPTNVLILGYMGLVVLINWSAGIRYMMPVIPFFLLLLESVFAKIASLFGRRNVLIYTIITAISLGALNIYYLKRSWLLLPDRPAPAELLTEATDWILGATMPKDRVCVFLPGDVYYLTDRNICGYFPAVLKDLIRNQQIGAKMQQLGIKYFILALDNTPLSDPELRQMMENEHSLSVVHRGKLIIVFGVR